MHLLKRVAQFITQKEHTDEIKIISADTAITDQAHKIVLTEEQQTAVDFISTAMQNPTYTPILLHGVTGSGKTEVYKKLITQTIQQGKSSLLLLPEISLAIQFEKLLRKQLPATIALYSLSFGHRTKTKATLMGAIAGKKSGGHHWGACAYFTALEQFRFHHC